uniref:Uncharacterized protein n=1 Tax=Strongyloides venezuelensis TaxID=75913 RepID=A0A0K0FZD9_STRVS
MENSTPYKSSGIVMMVEVGGTGIRSTLNLFMPEHQKLLCYLITETQYYFLYNGKGLLVTRNNDSLGEKAIDKEENKEEMIGDSSRNGKHPIDI